MKNKLKNWWLGIVGIVLVALDQGFDFVNPILVDLGITGKWIGGVKIAFALYGIWRLKNQLPTQNTEKLKEIVENKVADDIAGGGGKVPPPTN